LLSFQKGSAKVPVASSPSSSVSQRPTDDDGGDAEGAAPWLAFELEAEGEKLGGSKKLVLARKVITDKRI
jgi:hypothetical protein